LEEKKSPNLKKNARHRFNIFANTVVVSSWSYDAEMGPANSLHVSA